MREKVRSCGVRIGVLAVAVCATVVVSAASAVTTVTIGNTAPTTAGFCSGHELATDLTVGAGATSYAVPPGKWNISSWSTGAYGGSVGLVVLRPTATPGTYTVVGNSQVQAVANVSGIRTFTLGTIADPVIAAQGGDYLGVWLPGFVNACGFGSGAGLRVGVFASQPAVGATVSLTPTGSSVLVNISATLTPALPTTKAECKNGGWQAFGVFKNQGDCVSFVATGGKNQPTG
jgi:hypothetical protein